jgi:hypothetical protein
VWYEAIVAIARIVNAGGAADVADVIGAAQRMEADQAPVVRDAASRIERQLTGGDRIHDSSNSIAVFRKLLMISERRGVIQKCRCNIF